MTRLSSLGILFLASAAGCGSNGSYTEILHAYCDYGAKCGGGDAAAVDRCRAKLDALLHGSAFDVDKAIADGRVAIDGGRLGACTAAIRATDCSQFFGKDPACDNVVVGKIAVGAACTDNAECVPGSTCARAMNNSGCPGTCTALPTAGQPCLAGRCALGFYCGSGANPVCAAQLGNGSPCANEAQCARGLTCREPSVGAAKICRAYGSAGQPCGGFLGHDCAAGLDCDGSKTPAVCVARVGAGQPCRSSGSCVDGLLCIGGTCGQPLGVGASCSPQGGTTCAFGLVCDRTSSTCIVAPVREGTSCTSSSECENGADPKPLYCDGTCKPKPLLGESCTPPPQGASDPCAAGDCSPTTRTCALVCG